MKKCALRKMLAVLACAAVPVMPAHASQKISDDIELSGLLEAEASYADTDAGDSSDIVLATLELGIDAEIAEWLSAHVLFLYEEDETDGIEVDEAFVTLSPGDSGFFVNAGRFAQGIGAFPSWMITDPLTLELGETTQKSSVALGWGNETVEALVSVYKGDVQKSDEDHVNTWVGSLNVAGAVGELECEAGVSYTNNIADSDTLVEDFDGIPTTGFVGGYSGYLLVGLGPVILSGEYLSATDEFSDGARAGNRPSAWNVEFFWDFPSPLALAARVGGAHEFDIDNQYGAVVSWELYGGVAIGAEYLRNENADDTSEDVLTLQLAAEL